MRESVCLGAILIPECLDFHSGYSAARSRMAGIYPGILSYSGISQTNAPLVAFLVFSESLPSIRVCISSSDNLEKRFLLASLGSIIDHRWLQLKTVRGGPSPSIKLT